MEVFKHQPLIINHHLGRVAFDGGNNPIALAEVELGGAAPQSFPSTVQRIAASQVHDVLWVASNPRNSARFRGDESSLIAKHPATQSKSRFHCAGEGSGGTNGQGDSCVRLQHNT